MSIKSARYIIPLLFLFFGIALTVPAQTTTSGPSSVSASIQKGIELYGAGHWREAVVELRRSTATQGTNEQRAEALYWIALAELSAGEYESTLQDLDELAKTDPRSPRLEDVAYQKGRALYYLGRYDQAMVLFSAYADRVNDGGRKSAALYWMGECLYSLGRLDSARSIFTTVVDTYPQSAKFEAASYRIALIDQKKIENELLKLLKWSHEESLKTVEEYQRRERTYEQAIIAYQKRIAEMLKDTRLADLEQSNSDLKKQLAETQAQLAKANADLAALQAQQKPAEVGSATPAPAAPVPATDAKKVEKLLALKASALDLKNQLLNRLGVTDTTTPQEAGK